MGDVFPAQLNGPTSLIRKQGIPLYVPRSRVLRGMHTSPSRGRVKSDLRELGSVAQRPRRDLCRDSEKNRPELRHVRQKQGDGCRGRR